MRSAGTGLVLVVLCGIMPSPLITHHSSLKLGAEGRPAPYAVSLSGKVVQYGLSGFEPDFDPIDRVVISASLRDRRPEPAALPPTTLVLSAYLENFQPDTTPVLPDLLHPDQTATSLGGFMQGKAALVNAAGRVAYQGSLLAEVFLDNSVHLLVTVQRAGADLTASPLRFAGIFTLARDLSVHGSLRTRLPLDAADVRSLRVPAGRPVSWRSIVSGLAVKLPKQLGTAGYQTNTSTRRPAAVPPSPARAAAAARAFPVRIVVGAASVALIVGALAAMVWQRWKRVGRRA